MDKILSLIGPMVSVVLSIAFGIFLIAKPRPISKLFALSFMRTDKGFNIADRMIRVAGIAYLVLVLWVIVGFLISS